MKTRFKLLIAVVLLASVGWGFGWNFVSAKAQEQLDKALAQVNTGDRKLSCDNRRSSGFPFRLVVSCDETVFERGRDIAVNFAGLDAQAFVYRPHHQVVNFKSPARIKAGRLGTVEITWKKARLGSKLHTDGVSAATVRVEDARASLVDAPPEVAGTSLFARSVMLSARRTTGDEQPDSVVFGTITKAIEMLGSQYKLPPIDVEGSVVAHDVAPAFSGKAKPFHLWIQKGGEADIQGISLLSGNAELFAKGWVKLDLDGFLNADLDVDSANLNEFVDAMGPELVQIQSVARAVIGAMEGFGTDSTLNGQPAKRVRVEIRRGFVKIGFIPLGSIRQFDLSRFK
ncbi:MAG: DUF2125 domain-containing protein [Hyphomicrobiales bacterium]